MTRARGRVLAFTLVCLAALAIGVGAIVMARANEGQRVRSSSTVPVASAAPAELAESATMLFSNTSLGDHFGALATVPLDDPQAPRALLDLDCERVHYRNGRGICLHAERGFVSTYEAIVFDHGGDPIHTVALAGAPSRTKVAESGNVGAVTVFVTGHSYAQGGFSTQTTLIDLAGGATIADLETDFTVLRDGEPWDEIDFNFWGVTFVDDRSFYATLASGGETYLIAGDIPTREARIVRSGMECPSLSPDGSRIAFKERNSQALGPITWHLSVLDLASGATTVLAESRNVDDQVEWLDDDTVLYGLPGEGSTAEIDTWSVPANGTGTPHLIVQGAASTTVVSGA
jgi:hypothetical protein